MSDIAEGLGVAIEGSIAAKAVEPHDGTAKAAPTGETECANCGAPLTGPYCNQCGQRAHVHRTLTAIGHDLIHGVLHLDGKLWHTLPLLAFKPGRLTRRYIEGERAKFVSPMAMLLFSVFAMFAVFQVIGLTVPTNLSTESTLDEVAEFSDSLLKDQEERLVGEIEALDLANSTDTVQRQQLERELLETRAARDEVEQRKQEVLGGGEELDLGDLDVSMATGVEAIDKGIYKKWRENPGLMLYKLQANGYKFSWLLVPISLPFVSLLFLWRRKHKAYDHAVFVTYSLSFMSLFFIAVSLLAVSPIDVSGGWAFILLATLAPLHIYKHLKHTYGLSRFSALWRFFLLLIFMIFIILLFIQSLILLGGF
ncbi:MAG: DUF3667 domain-containing protein [Pseudomonadota bacterium]